jgi:sigma-B regulation protein RsbU (phosphoserine phosphatase)
VAITNARLYREAIEGERMAEQMRLAGVIQRRMIPQKPPQIPGLDIAATYIPCFDVGGDLYSFHQLRENSVDVAIADVIGKGIPAAIMMSSFRGAVQAYVDTVRDFPAHCDGRDKSDCHGEIINRINRMACDECRGGEFITLFHAAIDVGDMTITYCNCGHEPTVLIRDGQIIDLEKGGLVLGVDPQAEYEIETVQLKHGDCLLFYTDGLTDAVNFERELWGRENLLEAAKKFTADSAEQMIKDILGYRRRFVGLARQIDDTSMVVVRVVRQ